MRVRNAVVALSIALALALLMGWTSSRSSASPTASSATTAAKPIDKLTVATDSNGVDSPDPAYGGAALVFETTTPLLAYTPRIKGKVGVIVPGLATTVPKPTNRGKTYKFTLKPGIKYSNGKPVLASDFEYAIKRLYLNNGYMTGKFSLVKGADAFGKARKGDISGIIPNNAARTITFQLTAPMATFPALMGQYFAAPVPARTRAKAQDNSVPSTGPMMVSKFTAGQSYTLVKNPYYKPTTGVPASNVNTIVARVVSDPTVALSQTLSGAYDYNDVDIPPDQLGSLLSKNRNQTVTVPLAVTNMFSLNTTKAPFTDVRVRRAVNYAVDRTAMAKLSGGLQLPTQNVLPPGETSFKKITAYPYDLARAKSLVQAAGASGAKVTVLAAGDPASQPYAVYLVGQLNAIGLVAEVKVIPGSTFFGVAGVPETMTESSWYPWNELIPDASDWIGQLFDGRLIDPSRTVNWSLFNDPAYNKKIDVAAALPIGPARDAAWAALDQEIMVKHAAVVPYANPVRVNVFSKRINTRCYTQFVGVEPLLSNFCAK
jgi:peptide/nickel transport system substrate-binding protein